jgi:hypothetical protein
MTPCIRSKFQVEWGISIWVHQIGRAPCINEWVSKRRYLTPYIIRVGGELCLLIGVISHPLPKEYV